MTPKKLSDDLSISGQLQPSEIEDAKRLGFRALIVNRPDGEGPDQPSFEAVRAAAEAAGLQARYIPVSGSPGPAQVAAFADAVAELPKPILAFCKSGMRSAALWQGVQQTRPRG
ncbi:TIGR01244 family sulfur transferase [Amorphus sp. MBR-141]